MGRGDTATTIANSKGHTGHCRGGSDRVSLRILEFSSVVCWTWVLGCRYRDFDRFAFFASLDSSTESVFQKFSEYVFEMCGYMGERRVCMAGHKDGRTNAIFEFAEFGDKGFAVLDDRGEAEGGVYHADMGWVSRIQWAAFFAVRLGGEMQRYVLLCDQTGPYPGAQVFVEKPGHVRRAYVFPTLQKASGEGRNSVRMGLYEVGHDLCELDFIFEIGDRPFLVREQGG